MATIKMITVKQFCTYHQVDPSFIEALHHNGIIELVAEKRTRYIPMNQVSRLEQAVRMHLDLELNVNGIDTVLHLLNRLQQKEEELRKLKNRLNFYE